MPCHMRSSRWLSPVKHRANPFSSLSQKHFFYWLIGFNPKSLSTVMAQLWPGAPVIEPPG